MSTVAKSSLKKTLALLLALCLVFWAVPASAIGAEAVAQDEGSGQTEAVETPADTPAPALPAAEVAPSADAPVATPANTPAAEEPTATEGETPAAEDETPAAEDDTSAAAIADSASGDTADESAENAAENVAPATAQTKSTKKAPARAPAASDPYLTIDLWEMSSAGQAPLSDVSAALASLTVNGEDWIPYIDDEYNCYVSRAIPAGATVTLKAKTNDYWALSAPVSSSNLPDLSTTHNTEATEVTMTFTMPASDIFTNITFYECVPFFYDINGGTRGVDWPENDWVLVPKSYVATLTTIEETDPVEDALDEEFATPPAGSTFAGIQITDKNGVHTAAPGEKFTNLDFSEGATYKMLWSTPHTHSLTKTDKVDATCENDGTEAYWTCSECGKMFSDAAGKAEIASPVTIPATGHDWGTWTQTKAPTCTEAGSEERVCSHDASHKETREIAALGHDWGAWQVTKEATETEDGLETRICSVCGETETRSIPHLVVEYRNTEGDGSTWEKGSSDSLEFAFKRNINDDATFDHLTGIQVDGKDVAASNYTAVSGSVVVNLKPVYLETLATGEHTITAIFDDGNEKASADFTITEKKQATTGGATSAPKADAKRASAETPRTSDSATGATAVFALISAMGLALAAFARRKGAYISQGKHVE